jgi:ABC-type protease/lipase transport system fused ATPase/permease subunit
MLQNISFKLAAGEALGIVGPSGCGKTSLIRTLTGMWPLSNGTVRFDGAALDQWDPDFLGRQIGFLSQSIELFNGSIAENIARMAAEPDSESVIKAARAAGAHDMILRMPSGYNTVIGDGGNALSAGQRQRVALARAVYGDPFLIVLDEPNSNLDNEGELALQDAIMEARSRKAIVIIIAHRPSALAVCDKVLYLANGMVQAYGPRDEVMRKIVTPAPQPAAVPAGLPVVRESTR